MRGSVTASSISANKLPKTKIPNLQDGFTVNSITISSSYNTDESDIIRMEPKNEAGYKRG